MHSLNGDPLLPICSNA